LDALCWIPAQRFARAIIELDNQVEEVGLQEASRRTVQGYIGSLEVIGGENLPESGPVLLLSNHPGMTDSLSLFASLPRRDLSIVAVDRPFLRLLPNLHRRMIYVPEDVNGRMGVVRSVVQHLHNGEVVLICPAGHIEPDPAAMPGAVESLKEWSESIALFARLVPQAQVLPVIISGVVWPASLHTPLTRLRRQQKDRERLAAALQILAQTLRPGLRPVDVQVEFGPPVQAASLAVHTENAAIMRAITEQARSLIERHSEKITRDQLFRPALKPSQGIPSPVD
jgi:1-acyl-sn-glycerol-3-phosphate acyltransferase